MVDGTKDEARGGASAKRIVAKATKKSDIEDSRKGDVIVILLLRILFEMVAME